MGAAVAGAGGGWVLCRLFTGHRRWKLQEIQWSPPSVSTLVHLQLGAIRFTCSYWLNEECSMSFKKKHNTWHEE